MAQTTIDGQVTLTGTLRQQLEEVLRNETCMTPKELALKWFFCVHGLTLTDKQFTEIESISRIARDVFNQN